MTEPGSTGIGGDMFVLFWDAATNEVKSLNGSGRAGAKCALDTIRRDLGIPEGAVGKIPFHSAHAVTIPGAAAGWVDTVERFGSGKLDMSAILDPAIQLGERGFCVSEVMGEHVRTFLSLTQLSSWESRGAAVPSLTKRGCSGPLLSPFFGRPRRTLQRCSRRTLRQTAGSGHRAPAS